MTQPYTKAFQTLDELKNYLYNIHVYMNMRKIASVPKYCAIIKRDNVGELISWKVYQYDNRFPYSMFYMSNTGGYRVN